jgi:vacuolar-type H+-ATPase subunit H
MREDGDVVESGEEAVDILYLVDRLEELVGIGKRVPFSGRVMVEEEEFLALVDQLRVAVPNEIKQAQRVIKEREQVIGEAQAEASRILETARERAEYSVSQQGLLAEARQKSEELLRQVEAEHKRSLGEIDVYALKQIGLIEDAMREGMALIQQTMDEASSLLQGAKDQVGR